MIGPAQPQYLKPFAHRSVGMCGLRLDPGTDDIADKAVNCCRHPRVVASISPGPPHRRRRGREDRCVQLIDSPRALPTTATTRSLKRTGAGATEKAMKQVALAGRVAWQGWGKLLGIFGNCLFIIDRYLFTLRAPRPMRSKLLRPW